MVDVKALRSELITSFDSIALEVAKRSHGVKISLTDYKKWYLPLVISYVTEKDMRGISTFVVGLSGGIGAGKSILSVIIQVSLETLGFSVLAFSIDDYYKEASARDHLAVKFPTNPFYQHRGLFGSHKVRELRLVLGELIEGKEATVLHFDKGLLGGRGDVDRRFGIETRMDFVIFDGWCVGLPSYSSEEFLENVSSSKYVHAVWKKLGASINDLAIVLSELDYYQRIWDLCDTVTLLMAKEIKWIEGWRTEQEHRLIACEGRGKSDSQVKAFVLPFLAFIWQFYCLVKSGEAKELFGSVLVLGKNHIPLSVKVHKSEF